MRSSYLVVLFVFFALALSTPGAVAQSMPQVGGCTPGTSYNPACDVDHDGDVDIIDIQLAAGHWNQTGTYVSSSWDLLGNAGTNPTTNFLGTTDAAALTLKVNNETALRIVPATVAYWGVSPHIIGSYSGNSVSPGLAGATISGGGSVAQDCGPNYNLPCSNQVNGNFGTVGGGMGNTASDASIVGGGTSNTASGGYATVAGGDKNTASGYFAAIGGGIGNTASGSLYATIPGGYYNIASGNYSFAAGNLAQANHSGTFVWADDTLASFASTSPNQFLIRASGGVGIGTNAPQSSLQVAGNYIQFPTRAGAPPATDCDNVAEAGRIVVRTDGPPELYICKGTAGWVSK